MVANLANVTTRHAGFPVATIQNATVVVLQVSSKCLGSGAVLASALHQSEEQGGQDGSPGS
jgi:hypothetical protein